MALCSCNTFEYTPDHQETLDLIIDVKNKQIGEKFFDTKVASFFESNYSLKHCKEQSLKAMSAGEPVFIYARTHKTRNDTIRLYLSMYPNLTTIGFKFFSKFPSQNLEKYNSPESFFEYLSDYLESNNYERFNEEYEYWIEYIQLKKGSDNYFIAYNDSLLYVGYDRRN